MRCCWLALGFGSNTHGPKNCTPPGAANEPTCAHPRHLLHLKVLRGPALMPVAHLAYRTLTLHTLAAVLLDSPRP